MDLQYGDVIFLIKRKNESIKNKLVGSLVRWATNSQFVHVSYYIRDDIAFEANAFRTAGCTSLDDYEQYKVKRLNIPTEQIKQVMDTILSTTGSSYGWGEIISLVIRNKLKLRLFYDDPSTYICSSELPKAMLKLGYVMIKNQTTDDVSPADLWNSDYLTIVNGESERWRE